MASELGTGRGIFDGLEEGVGEENDNFYPIGHYKYYYLSMKDHELPATVATGDVSVSVGGISL